MDSGLEVVGAAVCREPLVEGIAIQAEFLERVAAPAVFVLSVFVGMGDQRCFQGGVDGLAEVTVDASHRCEGRSPTAGSPHQ